MKKHCLLMPFLILYFFSSAQVNVTTLVGSSSNYGGFSDGQTGVQAQFRSPNSIAIDANGNVYLADRANHKIRKITPAGVVTTLAGSVQGFADGVGTVAEFFNPYGLAIDTNDNLYVADSGNNKIRKISPAGVVTTLAGSIQGCVDGIGADVQFYNPRGVATDLGGNVYVADFGNDKIRKITPGGLVTTLAGSTDGYADGTGAVAKFTSPISVATDAGGNVYVSDFGRIRKITPGGIVSTLAGSLSGSSVDGVGTAAQFSNTTGVATDAGGNVYVADSGNNRIRKITPTGVVTTLAGSIQGYKDGSGSVACFASPTGIIVDTSGNVYVADSFNNRVRKVSPDGIVSTLSGAPLDNNWTSYSSAPSGSADGVSIAAQFYKPKGVAIDVSGNIYVADTDNNKIRKITPSNVTTLAGSTLIGDVDGMGTAAKFASPTGVATDTNGNVYVADHNNNKIKKITPTGVVTTFAGSARGYSDGIGATAQFYGPNGVATDAAGNVYVADTDNHKIRKITSGGVVSTFAGSDYGFVDGTGTAAKFASPVGIATDTNGNVYVADSGNNKIRKITSTGVVTTLAGSIQGDADGIGTAAQFYGPQGVVVDASGNIYVADTYNNRIKKITSTGVVSTLAGTGFSTVGYADGVGTVAQFFSPYDVAADTNGNVYVADWGNNKIRKITMQFPVANFTASTTTVNTNGSITFTDISTNTPASWAWEVTRTGSTTLTSSLQNPTFIFVDAGTYTVKLTATNSVGSNSKTVTNMITVTSPLQIPVANFAASTTTVNTNGSIAFTDISTNTPVSWAWEVSRIGSITLTSSLQNPTFTFVDAGTYTVKLTATNSAGSNTKTVVNMITVLVSLPSNNFTVESKGESCLNQNNGEISITAKANYDYVATINGKSYPFVNNSLKVSNLVPGIYTVSITIQGETFEQNFTITIPKGATITGKSSIASDKVNVEIAQGTAPYTIFIDGVKQFETTDSHFSVETKKGDLLEVKTAKACEGTYAEDIAGIEGAITVYPNPTSGNFEIELPTSREKVTITLYTLNGTLISNKIYNLENRKAQLSLENQPTGVYIAKIELSTPIHLKVIKK